MRINASRVLIAAILLAPSTDLLARDLTFAQRVEAQRAIERVYYIHRSGGARGFEEAVPESILVQKVRTYLAESVALEEVWNTPVTATMLRREVDRMTAGSRMPERLSELRAALGNDERLMAETLARAILVDRLCRSFLAADTRMATRDWDTWWAESEPRFDPYRARTVVEKSAGHAAITSVPNAPSRIRRVAPDASSCAFQDVWGMGQPDSLPSGIGLDVMVWTGSELIVWSGPGSRYDPATDSWHATKLAGAPSGRFGHTAVWTGREMIVWGGIDSATMLYQNTGGRYDPVADSWTPTSTVGAPPRTANHVAVWAGSKMVVWGGDFQTNVGGRYDPATDTWQSTSLDGAPTGRFGETAVWTGTEMIIWGGVTLSPGARYNPETDVWNPVTQVNAPSSGREGHSAVWTGSRMLIWGGEDAGFAPAAGLYDPSTDSWTPVSLSGAPTNRAYHATVWTGTEMIVWGGRDFTHPGPWPPVNSGGRYSPATDTWQPISVVNAPVAYSSAKAVWTGDLMVTFSGSVVNGGRYQPATDSWTPTSSTRNAPVSTDQPAVVWTGAEMIVWGGPGLNEGGRYDAMTDTWSVTGRIGAPPSRSGATAVWTGSEMILWGGTTNAGVPLGTGARYNPLTDTWAGVSTTNAPQAREQHTAIWTGAEMIVWGGDGTTGLFGDGGRYEPAADTWAPIPTSGAPDPRNGHAAVWTGHEMIVWGGILGGGQYVDTGGRFDPAGAGGAGAWSATTETGAALRRAGHTAIWTGTEMIVWGGGSDVFIGSTGGRYDPAADHWTPMSTTNAPSTRSGYAVVWTGTEMIVWGGFSSDINGLFSFADGARYAPASNTWTPTTNTNRPANRAYPAAVWTGRAMLVWDGQCWCGDLVNPIDDVAMNWYGNTQAAPPADLDGDGVTSCFDCDDQNPGAWAIPGEVSGLIFGVDDVTLSWSPPADPGAASISYDLLRSNVASDFQSVAVCLASGIASPNAPDSAAPSLNKFFYYLARARNACPGGIGTVGAGSSGVPRSALICP